MARRPAVCDGAVRWYLARAGEGREAALAADLRALLAPGTLADAFCPMWEMLAKRRGEWLVLERAMFPGYAVLASPDAPALSRALSRLSFAVPMAGRRGRDLSPVEAGVQEWLQGALDGRHVLRASEGAIRAGGLSVERGPLKGSEGRVRRIDRHKSMAVGGPWGRRAAVPPARRARGASEGVSFGWAGRRLWLVRCLRAAG